MPTARRANPGRDLSRKRRYVDAGLGNHHRILLFPSTLKEHMSRFNPNITPNSVRVVGFLGALAVAFLQAAGGDFVGAAGVLCASLSAAGLKKDGDAESK